MKIPALAACLLLGIFLRVDAQQDTSRMAPVVPKQISKTWIKLFDEPKVKKGVLYDVGAMSLTLSDETGTKGYKEGTYHTETFDVRKIDAVSVATRSYISEGASVGAVLGFIVGGAIGLHYYFRTSEKTEPWFQDACTGSTIGGGLGVIIGSMLSEKINIRLGGSQVKFDQNKAILREHSVR
jgi:hypothetical protein